MIKRSIYIIVSLVLFFSTTLFSQHHEGEKDWEKRKEQFKAERVGFITSKLQLTVEEAQRFWPLYNEYDAEREKIQDRRRAIMHQCFNNSVISDAEAEKISNEMIQLTYKEAKLIEEYTKKFQIAISPSKTLRLDCVEHEFRNKLIKRIGKHGQMGKTMED